MRNNDTCAFTSSWLILSWYTTMHMAGHVHSLIPAAGFNPAWRRIIDSLRRVNIHSNRDALEIALADPIDALKDALCLQTNEELVYNWIDELFRELPLESTRGLFGDLSVLSSVCRHCCKRHVDSRMRSGIETQSSNQVDRPVCLVEGCRVDEIGQVSQVAVSSDEDAERDTAVGRVAIECSHSFGPQEAVDNMLKACCMCCNAPFQNEVRTYRRPESPRLLVFETPLSRRYTAKFPETINALGSGYSRFARIFLSYGDQFDHSYCKIQGKDAVWNGDDSNEDQCFIREEGVLPESAQDSPIVFYRKLTR